MPRSSVMGLVSWRAIRSFNLLTVMCIQWRETIHHWVRRASRLHVNLSTTNQARWCAWLVCQTWQVITVAAGHTQLQAWMWQSHRPVYRRHRQLLIAVNQTPTPDCHVINVNQLMWRPKHRWSVSREVFCSFLQFRLSVCHTGGSVKNGWS